MSIDKKSSEIPGFYKLNPQERIDLIKKYCDLDELEIKQIIVPQVGPNDTKGTLIEWNVKDGDKVQKGDIIFSLETTKSVVEIESEYNGVIVTLFSEGEILNIGSIIAFIGNDLNIQSLKGKWYLLRMYNFVKLHHMIML